jgi:hypothetical protein
VGEARGVITPSSVVEIHRSCYLVWARSARGARALTDFLPLVSGPDLDMLF